MYRHSITVIVGTGMYSVLPWQAGCLTNHWHPGVFEVEISSTFPIEILDLRPAEIFTRHCCYCRTAKFLSPTAVKHPPRYGT
jgi:hypothetical protein